MSAEQFHQVVLLPQGQFAKFLHSDASERTALLQRLFGTDRFRKIEDWLGEQRRQSRDAFEQARHGVRRLIARAAQACGESEPDEDAGLGWLAERLDAAQEAAQAAEVAAEAARAEQARAQLAQAAALDLQRRQQRKASALDRQRALALGAADVACAEREIESARRAAAVDSALREHARRTTVLEQAHRRRETSRRALPPELNAASAAMLTEAVASGRETLGRLTEAAEIERAVLATAAECADASRAAQNAAARQAELSPLLAQAPEQHAAIQARIVAARKAAADLPVAQQADHDAGQALSAAKLRDARRREVEQLSEEHLSAREAAVEAKAEFTSLRNDRVDGMIAELAAKLVDGDPCPVCGAIEHPDPSEVRGRKLSPADEEAAARASDEAQERVRLLGERLASVQAELDAALGRLRELRRDGAEAAQLQAEHRECAAAVVRLGQEAGRLAAAEHELADAERALAERRDDMVRVEAARASALERQAGAAQRGADLQARLRALLAGAPDVATARTSTAQLIESVETALALDASVKEAEKECAAAEQLAAQAARDAGFADVTAAQAAVRDEQELASLEAVVAAAQKEAAAVAEILADPELEVSLDPEAPVAETAALARAAAAAGQRAEQHLATATQRVRQLIALQQELEQRLLELAPVEQAAARAKELADLASGGGANRLNMPLSAYVLAARLEEVAEVASGRLRAMTQGRYTLIHSDARAGNARSGLRLMVSDAWTGQDRDTSTLSGGETFLASLGLALGLAEVVTASAGGAPLDALFVDEGFGSLDEETLDEVLDVLDGLREGGRLVGIVSHVPHLRDRIPSRLRVSKGTSGSTVSQSDGTGGADDEPLAAHEAPVVTLPEPEPEPEREVESVVETPEATFAGLGEQLALLGAD